MRNFTNFAILLTLTPLTERWSGLERAAVRPSPRAQAPLLRHRELPRDFPRARDAELAAPSVFAFVFARLCGEPPAPAWRRFGDPFLRSVNQQTRGDILRIFSSSSQASIRLRKRGAKCGQNAFKDVQDMRKKCTKSVEKLLKSTEQLRKIYLNVCKKCLEMRQKCAKDQL